MRYQNVGLLTHDARKAAPGYTLFSPLFGKSTYLIGMRGEVAHEWRHALTPGPYAHLLENGNLLWAGQLEEGPKHMGGRGGLLREYDWDGKIVWEHRQVGQHHDFRRLPSGNTIFLGWETVPEETARRVPGGIPDTCHPDGCMYGDYIHEVAPDGRVVWEWHAHLDMEVERYPLIPGFERDEFAHANACAPLPNGDIMVSFRRLNTMIVIDRETRRVKWEHRDNRWGTTHDCSRLPNGNLLFFANGIHLHVNPFSRVIEMNPETKQTVWEYRGRPNYTFFSPQISGAQRFDNGNTLICEGQWGRIFEVTRDREIVWEYVNPHFAPGMDGDPANWVFRAYRYAADSPQIRNRIPAL